MGIGFWGLAGSSCLKFLDLNWAESDVQTQLGEVRVAESETRSQPTKFESHEYAVIYRRRRFRRLSNWMSQMSWAAKTKAFQIRIPNIITCSEQLTPTLNGRKKKWYTSETEVPYKLFSSQIFVLMWLKGISFYWHSYLNRVTMAHFEAVFAAVWPSALQNALF